MKVGWPFAPPVVAEPNCHDPWDKPVGSRGGIAQLSRPLTQLGWQPWWPARGRPERCVTARPKLLSRRSPDSRLPHAVTQTLPGSPSVSAADANDYSSSNGARKCSFGAVRNRQLALPRGGRRRICPKFTPRPPLPLNPATYASQESPVPSATTPLRPFPDRRPPRPRPRGGGLGANGSVVWGVVWGDSFGVGG